MEEKDYKKLYEDVVALAKDGLKDGLYLSQSAKAVTEFLFPQLKETEDEKVRKELVTFLINFNNGAYSRPSEDKIDSWIKWIDKKADQNYQKEEKHDEQKPADKIEPKFKVGDWITNGACIIQITSVDDRYYWHDNDCVGGDIESIDKEYHLWTIQDAKDGDVLVNKNREMPFIFKECKDNHIYCYCGYTNHKDIFFDRFVDREGEELHWLNLFYEQAYPATKEQLDLLFQKMYEAGYEWDSEKKELKKIEQESTWNEKIKGLNELETYILSLVPDRSLDAIKVDTKNIRYIINKEQNPEPNKEWSKEDSERLLRIHQFIWANRKGDTDEIYQQEQDADWLMTLTPRPKQEWNKEDETGWTNTMIMIKEVASHHYTKDSIKVVIDWLESVKKRLQEQNNYDKGYNDGYSAAKYNQWKPTDKQMEDFRMLLDYNIGVFDYAKFMSVDSLYEDLKKNLID